MFGQHAVSTLKTQCLLVSTSYKMYLFAPSNFVRSFQSQTSNCYRFKTPKDQTQKKKTGFWKQTYRREIKRSNPLDFKRLSMMSKIKLKLKRLNLTTNFVSSSIGVVGAPLVYGQGLSGSNAAPGLLRNSQLTSLLTRKGARVHDYGDLQFRIKAEEEKQVGNMKYGLTVGSANQKIADKVSSVLENNQKCLLLGGDHSVGLGSVYGHTRVNPDIAVIWVDAHPDINTPVTSVSGNLHGMPVSFLVKEMQNIRPPVPGFDWCTPCISASQLGYIGIRSIDDSEQLILKNLDICAFSTRDVKELGMDEVVRRVLGRVDPGGRRAIHLSFDVDVFDPTIIPATGTKVPCGITEREGLRLAKLIHSTGRLAVMDVVELNPLLVSRWLAASSAEVTRGVIVKAFCGSQHQLPWHRELSTSGHRGKRLPRYRWKKNLRGKSKDKHVRQKHNTIVNKTF